MTQDQRKAGHRSTRQAVSNLDLPSLSVSLVFAMKLKKNSTCDKNFIDAANVLLILNDLKNGIA